MQILYCSQQKIFYWIITKKTF